MKVLGEMFRVVWLLWGLDFFVFRPPPFLAAVPA